MSHSLRAFFEWSRRVSRKSFCRIDHSTGKIVSSDGKINRQVIVGMILSLDPTYQHWGGGGKPLHQGPEPCHPDCEDCVFCGVLQLQTSDGVVVLTLRGRSLENLIWFLQEHYGYDERVLEEGLSEHGKMVRISCEKSSGRYYSLRFTVPAQGEKSI